MNHFTDVSKSVLKLVRNNDRLTRAKLLLALQRWLCPEYFLPDPNVDWYSDPVACRSKATPWSVDRTAARDPG
jgi:hypothetical protein